MAEDKSIIGGVSFDEIYNNFLPELRSYVNYPIGEIIPFLYKISNPSLKLLDRNNVLKKDEYPILYSMIGDIYTDIYKHIGNEHYILADETQFTLPDMSGRYIVQGVKGKNYCFTTDDFQPFDLENVVVFGKVTNVSSINNSFKTISKTFPVNTTSTPIKKIINLREHEVKHQNKSINIADKCVLFYMRIK